MKTMVQRILSSSSLQQQRILKGRLLNYIILLLVLAVLNRITILQRTNNNNKSVFLHIQAFSVLLPTTTTTRRNHHHHRTTVVDIPHAGRRNYDNTWNHHHSYYSTTTRSNRVVTSKIIILSQSTTSTSNEVSISDDQQQQSINTTTTSTTSQSVAEVILNKYSKIILFDGVCNFCNTWVDILLRIDRNGLYKFTPLQSFNGKQLLQYVGKDPDDISSVVLIEKTITSDKDYNYYEKSTCVLQVVKQLGLAGNVFANTARIIVPQNFRDIIYDTVATNRYNLLGKRTECRCSDPKYSDRFI